MQSASDTTAAVVSPTMTSDEEAYIRQMTPKELKSYHIAKNHLTMSFDLSRSNGFLQWKSKPT
jgi:hypothetical protein